MYKFEEEEKYYSCRMTYEQYRNFKQLPIVDECSILKKNQQDLADYKEEMQEALNLAAKNDTSHIKALSEAY